MTAWALIHIKPYLLAYFHMPVTFFVQASPYIVCAATARSWTVFMVSLVLWNVLPEWYKKASSLYI